MKPDLEYSVDLRKVFFSEIITRQTMSGPERTCFILIPPYGCPYGCPYCSCRHLISGLEATEANAQSFCDQIRNGLRALPGIDTLKISNAGNPFHGTEFKDRAEIHETFWRILPSVLAGSAIRTVEVEISVYDLSSNLVEDAAAEQFKMFVKRIRGIGKEVRAILALEYAPTIMSQLGKFDACSAEVANDRIKGLSVPWLCYAMLGGRLWHRSLTSEEATESAIDVASRALCREAREVIVNCQYTDPLNRYEADRDGVLFYIPTREDIITVVQRATICGRLRISHEAEPTIKGTTGPELTDRFRKWLEEYNDALDQQEFLADNDPPS